MLLEKDVTDDSSMKKIAHVRWFCIFAVMSSAQHSYATIQLRWWSFTEEVVDSVQKVL